MAATNSATHMLQEMYFTHLCFMNQLRSYDHLKFLKIAKVYSLLRPVVPNLGDIAPLGAIARAGGGGEKTHLLGASGAIV